MEHDPSELKHRYVKVRTFTEQLCEPLETEDYVVQSMPDASPAKWHLAHTTWFFDRFILQELCGQKAHDETYNYLFNSYYNAAGEQFPRARRGLITRPTVEQTHDYRDQIDEKLQEVLSGGDFGEEFMARMEVGLQHERQHQELLLTDLKNLMWQNPLRPAVFDREHEPFAAERPGEPQKPVWQKIDGGIYEVGYSGDGFAFDNERPRHEVLLQPCELASRPVTCGEYLEFMADGGYDDSRLWLSDGWNAAQERGWTSPLYWEKRDGRWHQYTLSGLRRVQRNEPVTHVSLYEADAYATWAGVRLPDEREWEIAAEGRPVDGNFVESGKFHPQAVPSEPDDFVQMFGDVWEWTSSAYGPYPGFTPFEGALGEYNGKFMSSQYVLRGGSCASSRTHIRPSYRNFFYPDARWQFSGIRLARSR